MPSLRPAGELINPALLLALLENSMKHISILLVVLVLVSSNVAVKAETLRWARAGDALTLDPHARNEGPTHTIRHQMYEPLVIRDATGALEPALATEWMVREDDPNVWVFSLREGVRFHDGADFTVEDVVFSFERAKQPNSDMQELIGSIIEVRALDDHTVEMVTDGPNPILPANLTNLFIMDKGWAEANNAVRVQDFDSGEITFASTMVNGTGPYRLASREPDVRTVMTRNDDYWGREQFPMDISEIIYTPIQNNATRVAALLSGEVNFLQDLPVQDLDRVRAADGLGVRSAPQNRVIFLGMNMGAEDIEADNVDGMNPLADLRVRQAMSLAINRDAIQQVVMRGQSQPAGMIAPSFVNGWSEAMDSAATTDLARAQALMNEAGYQNGFSIRLDCPNDRYINDEAICQAVVGMLGQIGILVNVDARPKAQHFPLVTGGKSDFYLLGWGVPTYDSEYIFNFLVHGREDDIGTWNGTGYDNDELDASIESLASNTDLDARNADIADIWRVVQNEQLYIPIHHQVLNWAVSDHLQVDVDPEDQPKVKHFRLN